MGFTRLCFSAVTFECFIDYLFKRWNKDGQRSLVWYVYYWKLLMGKEGGGPSSSKLKKTFLSSSEIPRAVELPLYNVSPVRVRPSAIEKGNKRSTVQSRVVQVSCCGWCSRCVHCTHTTLTLHSHYTHTTLTLHSHYTHATLALHSHHAQTTLTRHSHYTHTTLTLHLGVGLLGAYFGFL